MRRLLIPLMAMLAVAAVLTGCTQQSQAAPEPTQYVWWEGEGPAATNFPQRTYFSASTFPEKKHVLSGEAWLTNAGKRTGAEAFARYRVSVPADGEYHFWTRKFWKHGPFRWRFDDGEYRVCGRDIGLADDTPIRKFLNANWVALGTVRLTKGEHDFELRLLAKPGEELTACFDAFLLTPGPFEPRGKLKPDERSGKADPGFFAWEPGIDPFTTEALLDLRDLNEKFAGEHGYVKRDGMNLTLGNGEPTRFWGVNVGPGITALDHISLDYLARRLAKVGVNIVRFHGPLFSRSGDPAKLDPQALDNAHYLVAALKKQGIYTTLSYYFPLWFDIKPRYGIPGFDTIQNKRPFALIYFDPRLQEIHRAWTRELLTTKNPYTGLPLGKDPAIAAVELVNEDSFFFWTFSKRNIPAVHWQRLEKRFGQWLTRRHGSVAKALAAWGHSERDDDAAAGRIVLYEVYQMTSSGVKQASPAKRKRLRDQTQFLTEVQRSFYAGMQKFIRHDLGCQSLVTASNWHVADPATLDALERYSYTANDLIDRHGYFSGQHKGEASGYAVRVGDTFSNRAATTAPEALPLQFVQIEGRPQIISEIGWTNPNLYRSDFAFLMAAYGSLQGLDATFAFAIGSAFWDQSIKKFAASSPTIMGAFPANALLYRRGDVKEAGDVVHQVLDLEDLYALKGSGGFAAQALDKLRQQDVPPGAVATGAVSQIDPLAFYVGRVVRGFGKEKGKSTQVNLAKFIDRQQKTVRSSTGQLHWDYGRGFVRMSTPRSQGVTGFLSRAGKVELDDVIIQADNEYGSILVISLDDQPLATSKKLLIQCITTERPYGFRASAGKSGKILDLGGGPIGMERIQASVTLKSGGGKVVALDEHGYPRATVVKTTAAGGSLTIRLAEDSPYHVIQR